MEFIQSIIAINPIIGTLKQAFLIKSAKNIGSFSNYQPALVLISCIIRINFWFFKPFSLPFLAQAIFLIFVNLLLIKYCVQFRHEKVVRHNNFIINFWNWDTPAQYFKFLAAFGILFGGLTGFIVRNQVGVAGNIIGVLLTIMQVSISLPQIINNFNKKSAEGISKLTMFLNITNDLLKTGYFIYSPFQFIVIGAMQTLLDFTVIMQMMHYRQPRQKQVADLSDTFIGE